MHKFFRYLFSRQMLAIVAVLLLSLVVWFVGPLLSFGELRPLGSIVARVTVIILLLVFLLLWMLNWPMSIIGIAALCLLVWHAGPLLAIDETHPIEPVWVRVTIIAVILLCYALYGLYRLWHALRTDQDFLKRILEPGTKRPEAVAKEEIRTVGNIVSRAISQLKQMRTGTYGFRRLFEGKRYLYELPWYMIVGAPGDGKTTALLNAGLQFPLAEQMGGSAAAVSVPGKGGTLHCDWWFTNEAVLIDTAGRYARHDDGGSEDSAKKNAAEWMGFLGLLRKYRPQAPVNGALLTINVADLLSKTDSERIVVAAALRSRLAELRSKLGIRFPVYLVVTKMDLLSGFNDYFGALTSDGRGQVWGFTLPYSKDRKGSDKESMREHCARELRLLTERLDQGITNRMQEEYDLQRRKNMYRLPQEFAALSDPLIDFVERVFLDSRFDATQLNNTLRGIYFTSAAQAPADAVADRLSLLQRFWRAFKHDPLLPEKTSRHANTVAPTSNRSYFLHDLLTKLVFQEAHLVQSNLQWEIRYRLMRLVGHVLAIVIFVWLLFSIHVSFGNNNAYLAAVSTKTTILSEKLKAYIAKPENGKIPEILVSSRELAVYPPLNPADPASTFLYGLYTAPPVIDNADLVYDHLLDRLLLPHIVRRVENVLSEAITAGDSDAAYDALRIYLQLHLDPSEENKYDVEEIKTWLIKDWKRADKETILNGDPLVLEHIERLFDGRRVVRSHAVKNETLIHSARTLMDGHTSIERIYERAKSAMMREAPADFTLVRAVGAQAGLVFVRASGEPLDRGVPGLFSYDGYHQLFNEYLPQFVAQAYGDDEWTMGRETAATQKKTAERVANLSKRVAFGEDPLIQEIRRLYLIEYTIRWQEFLADIHSVNSAGNDTSAGLAFDLQTLRAFAAPDSPLARLSKAVVKETMLVPPTETKEAEKVLADRLQERAQQRMSGRTREVVETAKLLKQIRREERVEKTLVDDHFAALREVVLGQNGGQPVQTATTAQPGQAAGTPAIAIASAGRLLQMDAIQAMLNEYYGQLVMADKALATNSVPPPVEASAKLRLEAAKLPDPLGNVLLDLATQSTRKINVAVGEVLSNQMEATIGNGCRQAIDGRYPFAISTQEVSAEDFNRIFAAGGILDEFFNKQLASQVDITASPWRYKTPEDGAQAVQGPRLDPFQRAKQIREAFFRDPGGRRMSWSMEIKVLALDPTITELIVDIDGQALRYVHGPVRPLRVTWPGPRNGSTAEITANPRVRQDTSTILTNGPWALFRLLERGNSISTVSKDRQVIEYLFDGRRVLLEINTGSEFNPLNSDLLKDFRCPSRLL